MYMCQYKFHTQKRAKADVNFNIKDPLGPLLFCECTCASLLFFIGGIDDGVLAGSISALYVCFLLS